MLPFRRDFDAKRLNYVVNHPSVLSDVATPEQQLPDAKPIDCGPIVGNLANIVLMCDEGGILAAQQEPGVYEIHTQFTEKYRGVSAIRTVREMINWMFINTDAMELLTKIPVVNKAALGLVRAIGGKFEFAREMVYPLSDGSSCDIDYYVLRYSDWLYSGYSGVGEKGKWFHSVLTEKKAALGVIETEHPEDAAHDINVGATVAMIFSGQVDKGLTLYNRWSRFAGYAEVRKISQQPLLIDIADAVLLINSRVEDFEVISCR